MADYKILTIPFARDAVPDMVNDIPEAPSASEPQLASYRQGFPVITTIPLVAGGLPPEGQDFNGILRDITQHIVHQNKGGMYKFAPEVVAAGGYAKGAVLASNNDLSLWVSLQNNNEQDFNTGTPTQWARIAFSGLDALLNTKADKDVSINAGTGLTGGGTLAASRTLSVNYGTTAGTAAQGDDTRIVNAVPGSRQVVAGTGLSGGGALSADLTLALGTPGTISTSSTNSVTATSHTHAITLPDASTSAQGIVQLNNTLTSTSTSQALTAAQGKQLQDTKQDNINAGSTAQYWRGDKTWRDFATDVRAAVLTGLSTASAAAVAASDSVLGALGKLQAQITDLATSKLDATANAVSATKLATARTINGVSFDGTANITVQDSTKLPLTGGVLTGPLVGTRGIFNGTGSDYGGGGIEVTGNGSSNTVFPTIGFNQSGLYASSIQLRGGADFRFYAQGGTSYANVTAASFIGNGSLLTGLTVLGMGQTWQNVTGSRSVATTYTNSTGKPIQIFIVGDFNAGTFILNGLSVSINDGGSYGFLSFVIPHENTYRLTSGTIISWMELR